jgi:predicted enzyme involved in methoxymalonyl-ACP biosynthesis
VPKVLSGVYTTIVLSVLLYGAETWVTNTKIMSKLNCFHNCCACTITGNCIRLLEDGTWEYSSSLESLKKANLLTIAQYITTIKKTVSGYVQNTQMFMIVSTLFLPLKKPKSAVWWAEAALYQEEDDVND